VRIDIGHKPAGGQPAGTDKRQANKQQLTDCPTAFVFRQLLRHPQANFSAQQQGLEGLCPEAAARVEGVHPTTVRRWIERVSVQAQAADQQVITNVSTENVELDELHSFAPRQASRPAGERLE
jgi:hypothetical protein